MHESFADRFWPRVRKDPGGCWLWLGARHRGGYGAIYGDGKRRKAHVVSMEMALGHPVPKGMYVCHHCDNPPCVTPAHLYVGTATDNNRDTVRRGRRNDVRTHCRRGHPLTPDNVYPAYKSAGVIGGRRCRICTLMVNKQSDARNDRNRCNREKYRLRHSG